MAQYGLGAGGNLHLGWLAVASVAAMTCAQTRVLLIDRTDLAPPDPPPLPPTFMPTGKLPETLPWPLTPSRPVLAAELLYWELSDAAREALRRIAMAPLTPG